MIPQGEGLTRRFRVPISDGGFRESNSGPLAPEASIMPLNQIPFFFQFKIISPQVLPHDRSAEGRARPRIFMSKAVTFIDLAKLTHIPGDNLSAIPSRSSSMTQETRTDLARAIAPAAHPPPRSKLAVTVALSPCISAARPALAHGLPHVLAAASQRLRARPRVPSPRGFYARWLRITLRRAPPPWIMISISPAAPRAEAKRVSSAPGF